MASILFSNLYRFIPSKSKENEFDLLLIDEAHRIEKTSNFQYTKKADSTELPQVEQLVRCAKTSVFFIDEKQNVRSKEIGSADIIREAAIKYNRIVSEVTLETQFRCMGSNDYLQWVESALGFRNEKRILRKNEIFDFRILDSPQELYDNMRDKENIKENSARVVAGYCWPWSKALDNNGELVKDVQIGDFAMPWETHEAIKRPPKGYVKWYEWAYRTQGIKQIGCIYTAQGFEFDYIGVIIGDDLIYDPQVDKLAVNINAIADPTLKRSRSTVYTHVRNIYRVLLTRGMKGCYVYFVNAATRKYFETRIEICMRKDEIIPFKNALPLLDLRAAANAQYEILDGYFNEKIGQELLKVKGGPFNRDSFIVRAQGNSMEPKIQNGDLCLFQRYRGGSRNDQIVLCCLNDFVGESSVAIIKKYRSVRKPDEDSIGQADTITLESINPTHQDIVLKSGDKMTIMGIFKGVIEEDSEFET